MTVYFDNAATTRVCDESAALMMRVCTECYGNPSSTHKMGREAKAILDTARKNVAAALGAQPAEIFFTSGGTEADNWAILSGANKARHAGRHFITTKTEHSAVLNVAEKLEGEGWDVTYIEPDEFGRISIENFAAALRNDTSMASVMLVNNETGALNDIAAMAKLLHAKNKNAIFHTDAVQGFLKVPFTAKTLGADMISLSSHKIHGPKGTGALYVKKGLHIAPYFYGGGQESGQRSGTEGLPGIAGFGEAARVGHERMRQSIASMRAAREYIINTLALKLPEAVIIGAGDAPHVLSLSLPGYRSEVILNCLEADGIYVSRSSACKKGGRSHVLEAMNVPPKTIDGAVRVSFSRYSTVEEAEYFCIKLIEAAGKLRRSVH